MQVRVLFFGVLKDTLKRDSEAVDLPQNAAVNTLLDHYRSTTSQLDRVWPALAVAVNEHYVSASHLLSEGDEVALLPPVSGGSDSASTPAIQVAILHQRIDPEVWLAALKQGEDGAVVVFDGIVRNNTRGRRTLYLVYESYETMALAQMRELSAQAVDRFGVRGIVAVHRLGRLEVGETSVFLAVASAHRAQAFDACRWLIDTLKKTVPIWKKEHFEDGAVWADGEPFPTELQAAPSPGEPTP